MNRSSRPFRLTRVPLVACLAAFGLVAVGCGSEDEDGGGGPARSVEARLSAKERAAVDEYRAFAVQNAQRHRAEFERFAAELEDGDLMGARAVYAEARMPWERIEPVAGLFGDLDPALDAREGDVPPRTWGGWHYFEKKLWIEETTDGLDRYIAESRNDAETLVEAARTVEMTPLDVAGGSVELLDEVSASKITGEEERYSHTDLWDIQANVEGSRAAFDAVAPLIRDEALLAEIRGRFTALQAEIDRWRRGQGFAIYTDLAEADRRALSQAVDAAAEPLSQLGAQLEA